jgi:glycyl-tRNA synthetase
MAKADLMDTIVNLAKRRGFVFPSSEIYGGFRSTWDYGPLGVELKRNVKDAWWRSMVQLRDDVVGLDAAILMSPKVWEASGHLETFTDPLVDCKNCKERFRADELPESGACPNCGAKNSFTEARQFHLMFKTHVGPVEDDAAVTYLRPETAQGIFVNFQNVLTTARKKPPFGIAQIGKSFRNEITPGNFIFRTREFEQMEMEYFVPPDDSSRWYEYWVQERYRWYIDLGIPEAKLRVRPHEQDELSHYSIGTSDVEFLYPWGWGELEGIAQRTDFDLTRHAKFSKQDLSYYDQDNDVRYVPYVVEPAAGADRAALAFLLAAYDEDEAPNDKGRLEARSVLRFHPALAPIKVAVLPLSRNDRLVPVADKVASMLRPRFMIDIDSAGSIGRRYRRQDEIGTPLCVTIDFDTLDDQAVTIRDRDTMAQDRVPIDTLPAELEQRLALEASGRGAGTLRRSEPWAERPGAAGAESGTW